MLRVFVVVVVVGVLWLQWRAAYISRVRATLADLPAGLEQLDDLVEDVRDRRLAYRCKAALNAYRTGDAAMGEVHVAEALERVEHLERLAPLGRLSLLRRRLR